MLINFSNNTVAALKKFSLVMKKRINQGFSISGDKGRLQYVSGILLEAQSSDKRHQRRLLGGSGVGLSLDGRESREMCLDTHFSFLLL